MTGGRRHLGPADEGRSELVYRDLLDGMAEGVAATTIDGRFLVLNQAMAAMLGYDSPEHLMATVAGPGALYADPGGRESLVRDLQFSGRQTVDRELVKRDGSPLWVRVHGAARRDERGEVVALHAIVEDITETRAAQQGLDATAERVELAFRCNPMPLVIFRLDEPGRARFADANPAAERLLGYGPGKLAGLDPLDFLHPEDRERELGSMSRVLTGAAPQGRFEGRRRHREGHYIPVAVTASVFTSAAGATYAIATVEDISERLKAQESLARSERLFRARFEQAGVPQAIVSRDGAYLAVNEALCELFGLDHEQLMGSDLSRTLGPPIVPGENGGLSRAFQERGSSKWEQATTRADGKPIQLLVRASGVRQVGSPDVLAIFVQDLTDLTEARSRLARREATFAALERHASEWSAIVQLADGDPVLTFATPAVQDVLGYPPEHLLVGLGGWVHPDDLERVRDGLSAGFAGPHAEDRLVARVRHADGGWRSIELVISNRMDDPDIRGLVVNGTDVTARIAAQEALRASEAKFRGIAETAHEGIWAVDRDGHTIFANQELAKILGRPLELIAEASMLDILDEKDRQGLRRRLQHREANGAETYDLTYNHPDRSSRTLHFGVSPLHDDTGLRGSLVMVSDITEAQRAGQQLHYQALYDGLTGIANRALLQDRLDLALARAERTGDRVAVLFIDLDHFKTVNDSLGHLAGDELLRQVTARLRGHVRHGDTLARFGGDEFVIVTDTVDESAALALAGRTIDALAEPFVLAGQRALIGASVGIALSPAASSHDLLRFADAAMHQAKERGRGHAQVFDAPSARQADTRLRLTSDLRDAIADNDLRLHYQPVVDLHTGHVLGVEALARWTHPSLGQIPPSDFVAVAENTGQSQQLDSWVLRHACRDWSHLRRILGDHARLAVNISAIHFTEAGPHGQFLDALRDAASICPNLTLEVTETAVMADPARAHGVLQQLRDSGIRIAVDDFGTGYSSLGYLSKLPIDTLKIDKTFVDHITEDPDARAIAGSIIDLARNLRLSTVAEGVEHDEQATLLRSLGCDAGQGYLWSPALPIGELENTVQQLPGHAFPVSPAPDAVLPSAAPGP